MPICNVSLNILEKYDGVEFEKIQKFFSTPLYLKIWRSGVWKKFKIRAVILCIPRDPVQIFFWSFLKIIQINFLLKNLFWLIIKSIHNESATGRLFLRFYSNDFKRLLLLLLLHCCKLQVRCSHCAFPIIWKIL